MNIVIVESPAKAKTINQYLGNDYKVISSVGHFRGPSLIKRVRITRRRFFNEI